LKWQLFVVAILISVILISITLVAFSQRNRPPSEVDTSWISTVERLIKEAKPYPPSNSSLSPPGYPEHLNVYLQENGTSTLIYYDTSSELSDYLDQISQSVDLEKNHMVSELFLSKVMEKDRVMELS
jgi:hypothetical protein